MATQLRLISETLAIEAESASARDARLRAKRIARVALALAAISVFALATILLSVKVMVTTLATFALFAAPGVACGVALFGHDFKRHPESLVFGSALGLAASAYLTLVIGYLYRWSPAWSAVAILALTFVAALFARSRWNSPLLDAGRSWNSTDYAIFAASAIALAVFVAIPYANIGKLTPEGHGYTWLFGFDFLLRAAFATSITQGLPPDYMHLAGFPLRYYLVAYAVPAFAYSLTSKAAELHQVLLAVQIATNLLFLACLQALLRHFVSRRRALLATMLIAMLGYSYYGWYVIGKQFVAFLWPNALNSALGERMLGFGSVSHLFQRLFLVEPQALTGLCLFLVIFFILVKTGYSLEDRRLAVLIGLGIGLEFGIEGWQGLALAFWFGIVQVLRLAHNRQTLRREWFNFAVALGCCAAAYLSYFAVGVYAFNSAQALLIRPYWWALLTSPIYFPVEYGPMFILGVWAFISLRKSRLPGFSMPYMVLLGLLLLQIFFLTAEVLPEFGLLRGNRLLPLLLLIWTGQWFQHVLSRRRFATFAVAALLFVAAIPTFFTDVYAASNVFDRNNTHYVRTADLEACSWIKHNLPANAIVQGEPNYVGHNPPFPHGVPIETSLIANFGERKMALGESWIAGTIIVNTKEVQKARYKEIKAMLDSSDPVVIDATAAKYHIAYLYAGPYELQTHPKFASTLASDPLRFALVYVKNGVQIFQVRGESGVQ